jgi:hypothetical protein
MRRKNPLFLPMLFLLFFVAPIYAATHYVDNSGSPACSNSPGNGSEAAPWCTISYGIAHINGGDTLNVKAGTYNDYVDIAGPAGSAGAPTIIQTYQAATVTILGSGVNSGRVKIENTSYITFSGFTITNWNQGLFVETADHITVNNCTVYNIGQEGIHVHYGSSFVTIDTCTVHDTGVWQYDGEGIYLGTGDSSPVDNTNNVTVHNCTIYNVTDEAVELKIGTHDITVDGNTIYNANTANNGYGGAAIEVNQAVGSVQHWDSNPNHVIRNNIIHDVGPGTGGPLINSGIRVGTGATVYNNLVYKINSSGNGLFTDNQSSDSYTRKIYHNTVDVTSARAIVNSGGTADIRNNIGPATTNNIATSDSYYANKGGADYHLVSGSAPINAGVDLTNTVPTDIEGTSRLTNPPPDLGAYEYAAGSPPAPPTNLTVIIR